MLRTNFSFVMPAFARELAAALLAVLVLVGLAAAPAGAQTDAEVADGGIVHVEGEVEVTQAHLDQIDRLYRATLGRTPDADGQVYWAVRLAGGHNVVEVARFLMDSGEAGTVSSGDPIADAYVWALDRDPDSAGLEYWRQYDEEIAVVYIADSPEHQATTETLPPPADTVIESLAVEAAVNAPAGWVDAGHGVYVPPILLSIRWCESHDNYTAANRISSARGAYQFLRSSWAAYGHAERYGVSEAHLATPAQQDEAAVLTWQRSGTRPWYASISCWG